MSCSPIEKLEIYSDMISVLKYNLVDLNAASLYASLRAKILKDAICTGKRISAELLRGWGSMLEYWLYEVIRPGVRLGSPIPDEYIEIVHSLLNQFIKSGLIKTRRLISGHKIYDLT